MQARTIELSRNLGPADGLLPLRGEQVSRVMVTDSDPDAPFDLARLETELHRAMNDDVA